MSKRIAMVLLSVALAVGVAAGCKKEDKGQGGAGAASGSGEQAKTPPAAGQDVPGVDGRRIDITVTKKGYDPGKVDVKAEEQVTLVFTRTENTECGSEVVIPSMNVKKALPLNEPVAIPFKADKQGEVAFACGMGMMQGAVVVQ